MVNSLVLDGHLGKDPETKTITTSKGETKLVSFTLAHTQAGKKGADGKDSTMWVDVTVFGKTGEFVSNYLKKGSYAVVSGRLVEDSFMDKQTNAPRTVKKMTADQVSSPKTAGAGNTASVGGPTPTIDDDSIPF